MRFNKFLDTYDSFATVQKIASEKLMKQIPMGSYGKVLELGCGTGLSTRDFLKKFQPDTFYLNDYFDTRDYLKEIPHTEFIQRDMDTLPFERYDLIISSSAFQWSKNLETLLERVANNCDTLAFSIYVEGNLKEIQNHFDLSLNYHSTENIFEMLKRHFEKITFHDEEISIDFNTPLDALKHLKYTGVTGFSKGISVERVRNFKEKKLTYALAYFICEK